MPDRLPDRLPGPLPGRLPDAALDRLFRTARTPHAFRPEPISDATLAELYDLVKWGPTAFNAQPARYVFVRSAAAKDRLKPALSAGNLAQTMAAAVTVIVAHDTRFFDHLATQFGAYDARPIFADNPAASATFALRNASLQGAYLMLAARALGLDAGGQSGFDAAKVDAEFFPDGRWRADFLVNLGLADPAGTRARGPRLAFDEVARIV